MFKFCLCRYVILMSVERQEVPHWRTQNCGCPSGTCHLQRHMTGKHKTGKECKSLNKYFSIWTVRKDTSRVEEKNPFMQPPSWTSHMKVLCLWWIGLCLTPWHSLLITNVPPGILSLIYTHLLGGFWNEPWQKLGQYSQLYGAKKSSLERGRIADPTFVVMWTCCVVRCCWVQYLCSHDFS